ncbi:30S ribosomal protein S19e [Candidatus Woesearchaeota archaeon]|nr:MAG: 30S ribosomal protein S19e [Candidatus Woesearchaeota archaeon]
MGKIYDVDANVLVDKAAEALKKSENVVPPDWAMFVKTGVHKERPPQQNDWWYKRAAALLRKVYMVGPIGVNKLRRLYGGKKDRGSKPEHFFKGSGKIIRLILQQLEMDGYVKYQEKGVHKGRVITPKGMAFLDKVSK